MRTSKTHLMLLRMAVQQIFHGSTLMLEPRAVLGIDLTSASVNLTVLDPACKSVVFSVLAVCMYDNFIPLGQLSGSCCSSVGSNKLLRSRKVLKSGFKVAAEDAVMLSPVSVHDQIATSVVA